MDVAVAKLGHVALAVGDLDRSIDFYTRLLGLRLTERFEYGPDRVGHGTAVTAGAFIRCDATHHCLALFALRDPPAKVDDAVGLGLHHLAFEMSTVRELVGKFVELKTAGVPIVNARHGGPGNQPRFYVSDPDRNLIEFYWGIDTIGWDGRSRPYGRIEEIDLERFDFEQYVSRRDRQAAEQSGQSE